MDEFLAKTYPQREIDPAFYTEQFAKSLDPKTQGKDKKSFESIRAHLTEKWQALLTKKDLAWQLHIIEQERAKFVKDLYARIEELKKLKDALQPFTDQLGRLWDMSRGNLHKLNFNLLRQYADLLQRSEVLQQLAEMLGRMRKAETELEEETYRDIEFKTVWRVDHAQKSELVGVREGDDLNHLLPGETALLSDPELEVLFYKRFAEKRLQIYEFKGRAMDVEEEEVERQRLKSKEDKKGPIIICVDTSGSMHGAPEQVAKVLCFALLKIALNEQRKCYLINFSTGIHTMDLTEFRNSLPLLLDFLGMSFHGGTDASPALVESLRMIETEAYRKSDVLMISDFVMDGLPKELMARITSAKEAQTKFHSLVIGHSANAGVVKEFDHNWHYDPNHPESLKRVLKEIGGM
ncbi:MAG: VWA domain-containing protein [Bacteroidia bacterium]